MKLPLPTLLLILASGMTARITAQKVTTYYDWNWNPSDSAHARFVTLVEYTDSGWHRLNYYVQGPVIQMEGWYEDSACKIPSGKFVYGYPDKIVKSTGRFVHGQKQGRLLSWHSNGMLADSTVYENGEPSGNQQTDTTTKDSKSYFGRTSKNWRAWHIYLEDNVAFPSYFRITRSDQAAVVVTFTVDVNGRIKDAYISIPFYGTFNTEVLRTVLNCPKWHPAIDHNRRVEDGWSQSIVFKNGDLSTTVIKD